MTYYVLMNRTIDIWGKYCQTVTTNSMELVYCSRRSYWWTKEAMNLPLPQSYMRHGSFNKSAAKSKW